MRTDEKMRALLVATALCSVVSVTLAASRPAAADAGDLGVYDTATLTAVQQQLILDPSVASFWMSNFFPQEITFDTEEIRFDFEDLNEFRLAPFVSPNVQGRVLRSRGFDTRAFKPAYVKPKHVVDPSRTILRRAGEGFGGTLTRQERYDAIVSDNLRTERQVIENRWEWMAARAIIDASVVVVGEDYPARTVDFNRDPSLTGALVGAAQWSQSTATPLADIAGFRQQVFALSYSPVRRLIFGLDAWNAFVQPSHPDVQRLLDALRRGSNSDFNTAGLLSGSQLEYQGTLQGIEGSAKLELYTYNNRWKAPDGTMVPYMDPSYVVGVGDVVNGIRCFGAILDLFNLVAVPTFPKMWMEQDPSVAYTMTQSAPLMVPGRINNTFRLKVV